MKQKRTFQIEYSLFGEDFAYAIIELDQSVIDAVDDDWRAALYQLNTPEEIAEHICFNMVENRIGLSLMDGWADMDNNMAKIIEWPEFDVFDTRARELKRRD